MVATVTSSHKGHAQLAHMRKLAGVMAKADASIYDNVEDENLVCEYDDGPDWPVNNRAKEQGYRRGFVESARRIVDEWAHPRERVGRLGRVCCEARTFCRNAPRRAWTPC